MDRRRKTKIILIFFEFLILLNFLLVPFYLINIFHIEFVPLKVVEAKMISFFLNSVGVKNYCYQNYLIIGEKLFEISWDSTGWKSIYLIFSLTLSVPIFLKRRLKFLIVGLILAFSLNLLRLFVTIYLFVYLGISFDFLHIFLWRYFMSSFVIIYWLLFLYIQRYNIGETNFIIGIFHDRRRKPKN